MRLKKVFAILSKDHDTENVKSGLRQRDVIIYAACLLYSVLLILVSENFAFVNQGDFSRAIGYYSPVNERYLDRWPLRNDFVIPPPNNFYALFLGFFALTGRLTTGALDLMIVSVVQKGLLFAALWVFAKNISKNHIFQISSYLVFALIVSLPHNSGIMKSFYPESIFIIGLMATIAGLFIEDHGRRTVWLLVGTLVCGMSKVQFFYFPTLVLLTVCCSSLLRAQKYFRLLSFGLIFIQVTCLSLLTSNQYKQVNHHHATYMGVYMVMNEEERESLAFDDRQINCIGVDAWGNRASGVGGVVVEGGHSTCFSEKELSLKDVLLPYLRFPSLSYRFLDFSMPQHFTSDYFHVYRDYKYLIHRSGLGSALFLRLSDARSELLRWPFSIVLLVVCLVILWIKKLYFPGWARVYFLLIMLIASQIVISILGEGIRDLSKHLLVAQFSIDILVVLVLFNFALKYSGQSGGEQGR